MARYDRIGPLPAPARDQTIPGWPVVLDLEDDDRNDELAERVRLRFLALRPLHRILRSGVEQADHESIRSQAERLREELGRLHARDRERAVLRAFIDSVKSMEPERLCGGALALAEEALRRGHLHGAEEAARTGLELAEKTGLTQAGSACRTRLAHVLRARKDFAAAGEMIEHALAGAEGHPAVRVAAIQERMRIARASGRIDDARADADSLADAAERSSDPTLRVLLLSAVADEMMERGDPEAAADHTWRALEGAPPAQVAGLLGRLAKSLRHLGMYDEAERAYEEMSRADPPSEASTGAAAEHALMAACRGAAKEFARRRTSLLEVDAPRGLVTNHLEAQLALGRGCGMVGNDSCAQQHLATALDLAETLGDAERASEAEALLRALQDGRSAGRLHAEPVLARPGAAARRVGAGLVARAH